MPKPMVPVLGKPLLERHIEQFKKHGVTDFFFTLHYLPEAVVDYFGDGARHGVSIRYLIEKEPLGSAGALKEIEEELHPTFYFIYGDVLSFVDYSAMAEVYAGKDCPVGMQRMERTDSYEDADVAELQEDGSVVKIHGKPHDTRHENAYRMRGSFILDKNILAHVPKGVACDLGKELLPKAVAAGGRFYSYECDAFSCGIDTPEKLREAEAKVRSLGLS
jgi:NDP-sugar pyrophosphorylase family protein